MAVNNSEVTVERDSMGRISAAAHGEYSAEFLFDDGGRVSGIDRTSGIKDDFAYDPLGRLTVKSTYNAFVPEHVRQPITITNSYDAYCATRLTAQDIVFSDISRSVTHQYGYDILDQVTIERIVVNGSQSAYNTYAYDGFGNRTNATSSLGTERIEYPNATTINRYMGGNTWTYTLDQRGNMVSAYGGRSFTYDGDNNLIAMSGNGSEWTFRYNAANQMVYSKQAVGGQTVDERFYLYDGLDVVAEVAPDGTVLREFLRAGQAIGSVVAEVVHEDPEVGSQNWNKTFYYHYNHRGDVIAVTRDSEVVFKADYDAYGNMIWSTGTFTPRYTFSTKRCFGDFNVYYYGFRWYLPELGRWMQRDPMGMAGSMNGHRFADGSPLCVVDAYGLYGEGVHYNLTRYLGMRAGIPEGMATRIAEANQSVDVGATDPLKHPLQRDNPHFQQYEGHEMRNSIVSDALKAARDHDADAFGRKLHEFQDTFAHEGYEPPFGHAKDSFQGRDPDGYDPCSARDELMTRRTEQMLRYWQEHNEYDLAVTPRSMAIQVWDR